LARKILARKFWRENLKRNLTNQFLLLVDDVLEPTLPEPELPGRVPVPLSLEPELDRDPVSEFGFLEVVGGQYELDLSGHLQQKRDGQIKESSLKWKAQYS